MAPTSSRPARRLSYFLLSCFSVFLLSASALADDIKVNNLWINNITIGGFSNGNLTWTTANGNDVDKPIVQVDGLRMAAYPDLAVAQAAFDGGKFDDAVAAQKKVIAAVTRRPWLKLWAQEKLVVYLDKANHPVEAVDAYLELFQNKAPQDYLVNTPLKSVASATPEQKAEIAKKLAAAPASTGNVGEALTTLVAATGVAPAPAPGIPATPGTAAPSPTGLAEDAVVLPRSIESKDPVAVLLRKGKFQEALAAANDILSKPTNETSLRLYEKGKAQMALADADGKNLDLYKDAGLSFMRVIIYFPRSTLVGPSLLEAGIVHQKINRPDLAAKLWDRAKFQIDADADPKLAAKLEALIAGENEEAEQK